MEDYAGQQFGNYQLQSLLGEGGFAQVYFGNHVHLQNKQAAIKILHHQVNQEQRTAFQQEAQVISALSHPHIIRLIDFGVQARTFFLVVDYAPGGTLRQRHPKGTRLDLEMVVSYVQQLAQALQYAHPCNPRVIHRDIKPENMLVGQKGEILLSDFGIAVMQQTTQHSSTQNITGTAMYMAPEQLKGHAEAASDQYALGIVVYEWLSGTPPFQGNNWFEIAYQHLNLLPPTLIDRVPGLTSEVDEVVSFALAKEPSKRFPSIQDFSDALEQCLSDSQLTEKARYNHKQHTGEIRSHPPSLTSSPTHIILPEPEQPDLRSIAKSSQKKNQASSAQQPSSPQYVRNLSSSGYQENQVSNPSTAFPLTYQSAPPVITNPPSRRTSQHSHSARPLLLTLFCLFLLLVVGAGFFEYTYAQNQLSSIPVSFSSLNTPEITSNSISKSTTTIAEKTPFATPTIAPTPTPTVTSIPPSTFTPAPTPTTPSIPPSAPAPLHIVVTLTDCDELLTRAQQLNSSSQPDATDELSQIRQRLRTCTLSTGTWNVNLNNHTGNFTIALDYHGAIQATLQLNGESATAITGYWDTNASQITFQRSSTDGTEVQNYTGSFSGSPAMGYTLNGTFTDSTNPGSTYLWSGYTNKSPNSGQI